MKIPLMLISMEAAPSLGTRFRGLGIRLSSLYPGLKYDLRNATIDVGVENFCVAAFVSALIWATISAIFIVLVTNIREFPVAIRILGPILAFMVMLVFFTILHLSYPKVIAKNIADKIDRDLTFAARDMLIQISSGIPLYTVLRNISESEYGQVSKEFTKVINEIRGGQSVVNALENMALRSQSQYLKKTAWQLITAVRAGANLSSALKGIVKLLVDYQFSLNKSYNAELNFIVLIYLLVSAVVPTVGVTVLVIFSVFGILGVTPELFAAIVSGSFIIQLGIIGYVYVKRPNMYV
jgi:archaeal flagellar protein FlaJ